MRINLFNTAIGMIPLTDADHDEKKKLKIGEFYVAEIIQPRSPKFHRLYFGLINCAWEYLNERQTEFFNGNKEVFRKSLEVAAGHCDKVFSFKLKEWVDVPKSISFSEMDEIEFRELYERVKNILFTTILRGISEEEFNKNLINF